MERCARWGLIGILAVAATTVSRQAAGNVVDDRVRCVSPAVRTPDNHCCPPNEAYNPTCNCCRSLPSLASVCESGKAPEKCLEAGEMYDYGRNRDAKRAADMFEKACARGIAVGCVKLAHFYEEGIGRKQDPARALQLYDRACAGKILCACVVVGVNLSEPERSGRDARRGALLLASACDDGDMLACRWLARRYREGRGVVRSHEKANELRARACAARVRDACDGVDPVSTRETVFRSQCRPGRIANSPAR